MDEDPVFYRKLGEMLRETYEEYRRQRFEQVELLRRVQELLEHAQTRKRFEETPAALDGRPLARTYFDITTEKLREVSARVSDEEAAELAVAIDDIIRRLAIVNWQENLDVQNRMRIEIEDEMIRFAKARSIDLSFDVIDEVMDKCIEAARRRWGRE